MIPGSLLVLTGLMIRVGRTDGWEANGEGCSLTDFGTGADMTAMPAYYRVRRCQAKTVAIQFGREIRIKYPFQVILSYSAPKIGECQRI